MSEKTPRDTDKAAEKKKPRRQVRAKAIAFLSPEDGQVCCVGGTKLSEAMEDALEGRDSVIMCRVNQETLQAVDTLVEAGLCDSRSTAAAFLIREGIKADAELFTRIRDVTKKITELKSELRRLVEPVLEEDKDSD